MDLGGPTPERLASPPVTASPMTIRAPAAPTGVDAASDTPHDLTGSDDQMGDDHHDQGDPMTRRQSPMPLTTDTTWRRCVCCGPAAERAEEPSGRADEDGGRLPGDPGEHEGSLLVSAQPQLATHGVRFE